MAETAGRYQKEQRQKQDDSFAQQLRLGTGLEGGLK